MITLADLLKKHIQETGPISVADYMTACLGHPTYGYYMTRDPFGRDGDFTTAPEISQMFGELIGLWLAQCWMDRGSPTACHLIECGPGRGTLMADILRTAKGLPEFYKSLSIHLVETSPTLRKSQEETLKDHKIKWHTDLSTLPSPSHDQGQDKTPQFIFANELFDALPIQQLVMTKQGWRRRLIGVKDEEFQWMYGTKPSPLESYIAKDLTHKSEVGTIAECSPFSLSFAEDLGHRISQTNGIGLFIDYGYVKPDTGDSLQAMKNHAYCDVLEHSGEADLTAHVNFHALSHQFSEEGCNPVPILTQGDFLTRLGIQDRAKQLMSNATQSQKTDIEGALKRLIDTEEMGSLFKVLAVRTSDSPKLAGFEPTEHKA